MINLSAKVGKPSRYLGIWGVILVFGVIVGAVLFWFRGELTRRVVFREVAILAGEVGNLVERAEEEYLLGGDFLVENKISVLENLADVPGHLVDALLGTLGREGVQGMQVFDREGFVQESLAAPEGYKVLPDRMLAGLKKGKPRGKLISGELDVMVPLLIDDGQEKKFLGVANYILDGKKLLDELSGMDAQLFELGFLLLIFGGGLVGWVLSMAFNQMVEANRLLEERGRRLASANDKLLLSAKTSAVGSLTANLVHGLKNPLGSFRAFLEDLKHDKSLIDQEDISLAGEALNRMQDLIQDTLAVIESSGGEGSFTFTLQELQGEIRKKLVPIAKSRGVQFSISGEDIECEIDNVRGNLLVLILCNLGQNAIEASKPDFPVVLEFSLAGNNLECLVRDEAGGLPEWMRKNPFQTVRSSKEGGSGIGLALSQQLARQMDATLVLGSSSENGTVFIFSLWVA